MSSGKDRMEWKIDGRIPFEDYQDERNLRNPTSEVEDMDWDCQQLQEKQEDTQPVVSQSFGAATFSVSGTQNLFAHNINWQLQDVASLIPTLTAFQTYWINKVTVQFLFNGISNNRETGSDGWTPGPSMHIWIYEQ